MYVKQQAIDLMNQWGGEGKPFLFIVDYRMTNILLYPLAAVPLNIYYNIKGAGNTQKPSTDDFPFSFESKPVPFEKYLQAFEQAQSELNYGNSYLLNLTFPSEVKTNLDLKTIFHRSSSPYKLLVDHEFVIFSPETFVRFEEGKISSYPMKGTIDASFPNAEKTILNSMKESAEHATIVDLIRNDLNRVASNVEVTNYRYVEEIKTFKSTLLQVSSKIEGDLPLNYERQLGDIIFTLLPAGSVTGAPKKKTLEIIEEIETDNRGFYTGVFGVFDGKNLDSGVMIRFIEQKDNKLVFRSGGGITAQSKVKDEYQELIDKVYVPFI